MGKRSGIMLAYPFEEKRLLKWSPPFIVQPKLDGERCRAIVKDGEVTLLSSEQNEFWYLDHIKMALLELIDEGELDGELYVHGRPFEHIHSIASRVANPHPKTFELEYHVFDVVTNQPQDERLLLLGGLSKHKFHTFPAVKFVPHFWADTLDDVVKIYDEILSKGYEGIIIRSNDLKYERKRSTSMMKFKPKKADHYSILGYKEEVSKDGELKGSLGALICVSGDGETFNVGTGLTRQQRDDLWAVRDSLRGKVAVIYYQHITPGRGVPRFPVFARILGE